MNDLEMAYLAGIIDGEGCVVIHRRDKADYYAHIIISNTSVSLISKVNRILEEKCYIRRISPSHLGKKPIFEIRLGAKLLRKVLPQLIPHLSAKKGQAKIVLEFLALGYGQTQRRQELRDILMLVK